MTPCSSLGDPGLCLQPASVLFLNYMLNLTVFVNSQLCPVVNSSTVAPVVSFLFNHSMPRMGFASSKPSSFNYLLQRPAYKPQRHYNLQASLEVTRRRPYSGASHA
jgi:hypothetical protein